MTNSNLKTHETDVKRLRERQAEALADIASEELGSDQPAPEERLPREIPRIRKSVERHVYTGPEPADDRWERVRKKLLQSRPPDLGGGTRQPNTTDNLATALKDKGTVRAMLHLLGIHDTHRAFSGKPFQFLQNGNAAIGPVALSRNKSGQYTLLVIPTKGTPVPMSLGTAHAKRVRGAPGWPFVLKTHTETRLWCGRLIIESDPDFERTPLPWLTREDFVRAVTKRCGVFGLKHAIGLCVGLSTMLDAERKFLPDLHREHKGYVAYSQSFRPRWVERAVRGLVTAGESDFVWGSLRKFGYVEMIGGEAEHGENGKLLSRAIGYYRFAPKFQQKEFNVREISEGADAVFRKIEKP